MEDRRRAEKQATPTVSRQARKEQQEIVEDLAGKTYAKKSIKFMLLRLLAIIVLLLIATFVGLMIGYGVIGDGKVLDVFKPSTWTHVFDIMNGTEK